MPIEPFHISPWSTHNKQQAGIKSICTEERGKKLWQLQICVQISVVNGPVPPYKYRKATIGNQENTLKICDKSYKLAKDSSTPEAWRASEIVLLLLWEMESDSHQRQPWTNLKQLTIQLLATIQMLHQQPHRLYREKATLINATSTADSHSYINATSATTSSI